MLRDEFERLALAELEPVYRFARSLTRDTDRAEELVQEVYARAFRAESIASFVSRGGGMRAWLMTIARTRFYGMLEREQAGARVIEGARDLARCDSAGEDEAPVAVEFLTAFVAGRVAWWLHSAWPESCPATPIRHPQGASIVARPH